MSEKIEIISTSTVRAPIEKESPVERVELTPWDIQLLALGPIQTGLLFNKPQNLSTASLIHRLKTSLSHALRFFPPLAGRLSIANDPDDNTTSFFIDCNNAGAEFTHATANSVAVTDIVGAVYVPAIVTDLFPLNSLKNYEGVTKPLLAVQVTELSDGVFVGTTMNHVVVDGTSFWHFMNSWSEISRESNSDTMSKPPSLKRWFPEGVNYPIRVPTDRIEVGEISTSVPILTRRVFHFRKETTAQLKAKANWEMGTDKISSLQAVLAHLWRSIVRHQHFEHDMMVLFILAIGVRDRIQPPLPQHYFGNAIQGNVVISKAGEVVENGIGHVAMEMNKVIGLHTHEKVESFYKSWVENPSLVSKGDGKNTNFLFISNSPVFDVYGNDFGWGRPVATRSGNGDLSHGKISLLPGPKDGSIDVEVSLFPETHEALGQDIEFMAAVTVNLWLNSKSHIGGVLIKGEI